ncbi:MAG: DNRLRE domain-containing protein [Candidatus Atribacteria bacterium]|nr:DNRLRE domain-containing protein [Candidatus Atribacteria bacterium]
MFKIPEGKKCLILLVIIPYLLLLSACDGLTPALTGSIAINSTPAEAIVYLDGVYTAQTTPTVLTNVSAGTHTVKLVLYLYESKEETNVLVTAGETTNLEWTLTPVTIKTMNLQPGSEGKDAEVNELVPDTNSGNTIVFFVGYRYLDFLTRRAYLYFDVNSSSLPLDAVVTSAYLKLHQGTFIGTGSLQIGLYPVTGDWEESTITWNNQPTSLSETEYTTYVSSGTDIWRTWHIKYLVKGWLDGSITNKGMLLKSVNEPATTSVVWFESSDHDITDRRPQLVIEYYVP